MNFLEFSMFRNTLLYLLHDWLKVKPKELMKWSGFAKEKLALTRRELHSTVILTSQNPMERFWTALAVHEVVKNRTFWIKFTTQVGIILTSKDDHLFSSFGISCWNSKHRCRQGTQSKLQSTGYNGKIINSHWK